MKCHTLEYEKLTFYLSISLILKLEYRQKKKRIIIKIVFKFMKKIYKDIFLSIAMACIILFARSASFQY